MKFRFETILAFFILFSVRISAQSKYYNYVDPMIGSKGEGNVFVGPCLPFGMIKPGPDCGKGQSNSGYLPDMNEPVIGFSQVHVSGKAVAPNMVIFR
ncbi:MAG TPA: hypothetical protein VNW95_05830 [Mucilaginibacter sp.]|jgi:putative alpha-1,2-mannosidase|nr:hypothetical protein [Mucilaginibacter sp.]